MCLFRLLSDLEIKAGILFLALFYSKPMIPGVLEHETAVTEIPARATVLEKAR